MRDVADRVREWRGRGQPVALATVVGVADSAPRQPGATMAVSGDGEVAGSVSGGCVEGAVVETAEQVLASGRPQLVTYGYSDADAFAVGLTCGGRIQIFVERLGERDPVVDRLTDAIETGEPVAVATVLDDGDEGGDDPSGSAPDGSTSQEGAVPRGAKLLVPGQADGHGGDGHGAEATVGSLGSAGLDAAVADDVRGLLARGGTVQRRYGRNGQRRHDDVLVFAEAFVPPPRMYVFGAIDYAAAVAGIGKFLGYTVVVCDARAVFATPQRFPEADEVVVEWPHRWLASAPVDERTVICVLTHDPKFDVPLLEVALRTPAAYIGAMGSRRTHSDRLARLRDRGLSEEELARLRSPIGLDIGGRTPEETAISVAAEIISLRWHGSGRPLAQTQGAIHAGRAADVEGVVHSVPR